MDWKYSESRESLDQLTSGTLEVSVNVDPSENASLLHSSLYNSSSWTSSEFFDGPAEPVTLDINVPIDAEVNSGLYRVINYPFPDELHNVANFHPGFYPIVTTYTATFIVGVIGNIAVIRNWAEKRSLRSPTAFLVSLAVADLLMLLLYMPLKMVQYFVITWEKIGTICQLTAYIEILSGTASVLNLVAVSVERFLVIVFPMRARSLCTISKKRKGLLGVWILAVILSLPALHTKTLAGYIYKNNSTQVTAFKCEDVDDRLATGIAAYQLTLMFVVPGAFMTICYFVVIKVLWSSTKNIRKLTGNSNAANGDHVIVCSSSNVANSNNIRGSIESDSGATETFASSFALEGRGRSAAISSGGRIRQAPTPHQQTTDRKQVIKMLILVILLFLLCWGPRLINNVIVTMSQRSFSLASLILFYSSELLPFVHSALNPFVYGLMSRRFRSFIFKSCAGGNTATEATVAIESIALSSGVHSTRNGQRIPMSRQIH